MNEFASKSEADRLGKRGSYRLGALGRAGLGRSEPPRAFQPSFARPTHRGAVPAWILAGLAATALVWWAATAGLWFMPVVIGLLTGIVIRWGRWRLRVSVPAVLVMTAGGWGLGLWVPALGGLPIGATGRTIAALAGLPASAVTGIAVTLAVSALQGLAGLWLGRAISPRPARD